MTVTANTSKKQYTGNGSTTVFVYNFEIIQNSDMVVFLDQTQKTIVTDYTVSGAGNDAGGNVTFVAAPANGVTITLFRDITSDRTTQFQPSGSIISNTLNADFDKTWMAIQELEEAVGRKIGFNVTDTASGIDLPSLTGNNSKLIGINSAATGLEAVTLASISAITLPVSVANGGTGAATAGAARTALGSTTVGDALFIAANAAAGRTALGSTTIGDALFIAANDAAAQQAFNVEVGVDVQAFDANTAKTDVAQEYTKTQNFNATGLTDGANISWDVAANQVTSVTLAGNRTLVNPTNMKDGATYIVIVTQDGTGSRTLAYGTAYKWPGGTAPTLSTGANAVDILTFISDGTSMFGGSALAYS